VICALGDLILDVIVCLDGPIAEHTDTYGQASVGVGGPAANVAAWATALGGRGVVLARRADDVAGRLVADELARHGVGLAGPRRGGTTGTVVSIASLDGRRTMLTDRGSALDFEPDDLEPACLDGCETLHVPAYSLAREPIRSTALAAAGTARRGGARVSLDLSSVAVISAAGGSLHETVAELAPDVVFANEAEAELYGPLDAPTVVVKLGARGCRVETTAETLEHPAVPTDVVDTTGAGDTFAVGFLLGGADLALDAAARSVARMGAMPW